jgi:hypothetical protein
LGGQGTFWGLKTDRVCFQPKNSWVSGTQLYKQTSRSEQTIDVWERRGDIGEPVAKNRAPNDSGKGSKLSFDLSKRG